MNNLFEPLGQIQNGGKWMSITVDGGTEIRPIVELTRLYAIARVPPRTASGGMVIMCRKCRRVSRSADDVAEKYCGFCHEFLTGSSR